MLLSRCTQDVHLTLLSVFFPYICHLQRNMDHLDELSIPRIRQEESYQSSYRIHPSALFHPKNNPFQREQFHDFHHVHLRLVKIKLYLVCYTDFISNLYFYNIQSCDCFNGMLTTSCNRNYISSP